MPCLTRFRLISVRGHIHENVLESLTAELLMCPGLEVFVLSWLHNSAGRIPELLQKCPIRELRLHARQLKTDLLVPLSHGIPATTTLQILDFGKFATIAPEDFVSVLDAIVDSKTKLNEFTIPGHNVHKPEFSQTVEDFFAKKPKVHGLMIPNAYDNDIYHEFCVAPGTVEMFGNLTALFLEQFAVVGESLSTIANFLQKNRSLEFLTMCECSLVGNIDEFFFAIAVNNTLISIVFTESEFDGISYAYSISRMLVMNSTVTYLCLQSVLTCTKGGDQQSLFEIQRLIPLNKLHVPVPKLYRRESVIIIFFLMLISAIY